MLKGKTAIITGASGGIGAAIALKFAECGANVAIVYNGNAEKARKVAENAATYGDCAKIYKCDVSQSGQCEELVKVVNEDFGGVDILVNNAGITRDNLIVMMNENEFDCVIDTNLKGTFNMIKACSRGFIKKKYGKIINISSVSGIAGLPGQANYSASKAGIIGLTKSVAKELGAKNICCNAIAPGFIETDMTKDLNTDGFMNSLSIKRPGQPEDVANAALFLACDLSGYITGEVIRVDGGLAI